MTTGADCALARIDLRVRRTARCVRSALWIVTEPAMALSIDRRYSPGAKCVPAAWKSNGTFIVTASPAFAHRMLAMRTVRATGTVDRNETDLRVVIGASFGSAGPRRPFPEPECERQ